jgi:hypothetical protein
MGKRALCLGLIVLLLACTNVFAGGAGNPVQLVENKGPLLDVGGISFEYNYVPERANELNDSLAGPEDIEVERMSQMYGKIVWGVEDYNVYANIGTADYDLDFNDDGIMATLDLETGPYFGMGVNKLFPFKTLDDLCDKCTIGWGADIQVNVFLNDIQDISRAGTTTSADGFFYGLDGQNSAYITCKYDIEKMETSLIPYLGVYHSWIVVGTLDDLKYNITGVDYNTNMDGAFDILSFGLLLGLDVTMSRYATFNVEGRFVGETAITTGATLRF